MKRFLHLAFQHLAPPAKYFWKSQPQSFSPPGPTPQDSFQCELAGLYGHVRSDGEKKWKMSLCDSIPTWVFFRCWGMYVKFYVILSRVLVHVGWNIPEVPTITVYCTVYCSWWLKFWISESWIPSYDLWKYFNFRSTYIDMILILLIDE